MWEKSLCFQLPIGNEAYLNATIVYVHVVRGRELIIKLLLLAFTLYVTQLKTPRWKRKGGCVNTDAAILSVTQHNHKASA